MKPKVSSLKRSTKLKKTLARLIMKTREMKHVESTTDFAEIKAL